MLSLYFDKSASCKADNILGMYCGFAKPTCARALTHCLAVMGFSSVIWARKSGITPSKRFSSSHCAFAIFCRQILNNVFFHHESPRLVLQHNSNCYLKIAPYTFTKCSKCLLIFSKTSSFLSDCLS